MIWEIRRSRSGTRFEDWRSLRCLLGLVESDRLEGEILLSDRRSRLISVQVFRKRDAGPLSWRPSSRNASDTRSSKLLISKKPWLSSTRSAALQRADYLSGARVYGDCPDTWTAWAHERDLYTGLRADIDGNCALKAAAEHLRRLTMSERAWRRARMRVVGSIGRSTRTTVLELSS